MILVTVGTQLNFNRLIKAVEKWASGYQYSDIVFQTGNNGYVPDVGKSYDVIPADELDEYLEHAELVIAHAGMGTILTCLTKGIPVVIMPRLFKYGEHRNDHQLATFYELKSMDGVFSALDESELSAAISAALDAKNTSGIDGFAQKKLISFIKSELI